MSSKNLRRQLNIQYNNLQNLISSFLSGLIDIQSLRFKVPSRPSSWKLIYREAVKNSSIITKKEKLTLKQLKLRLQSIYWVSQEQQNSKILYQI